MSKHTIAPNIVAWPSSVLPTVDAYSISRAIGGSSVFARFWQSPKRVCVVCSINDNTSYEIFSRTKGTRLSVISEVGRYGRKLSWPTSPSTGYTIHESCTLIPHPISVICVVWVVSTNTNSSFVSYGGATLGYGWQFGVGNPTLNVLYTLGNVASYTDTNVFSANTHGTPPYCVAGITANRDGGTVRYYSDGAYRGFDNIGTMITTTEPLRIGCGYDGSAVTNQFRGDIALVAITNKVISDADHREIAADPFGLVRVLSPLYSHANLGGTIIGSQESDIVTGGKTITLTLHGATFVPA